MSLVHHTASRGVFMLAYQQCQVLDVTGPVEALEKANTSSGKSVYDVQIIAPKAGNVQTSGVVQLAGARAMTDIGEMELQQLDTLMIAGGVGVFEAMHDAAILEFVRLAAKHARRVISVCSGSFLLAEAGLLDNRRATTHWDAIEEMADRYPLIDVDNDAIYIRDGNYWTSAGVTAGIDLTLALIEADLGSQIALQAARKLVVYMMRPGGQAQFSAQLKFQRSGDRQLQALIEWIDNNSSENLSVAGLASRCAMSERNFTRRFTSELGISPARFVEQSRLQYARRQLEETDLPLQQIADRCGFKSVEILRRLFNRKLSVSPGDYRKRFRTSIRDLNQKKSGTES